MKVFKSAVILMTIFGNSISQRNLTDFNQMICYEFTCVGQFNCNCQKEDWGVLTPQCIPFSSLCDDHADCTDSSDELDCTCPPSLFQCGSDRGGSATSLYDLYNCIDLSLVGNGEKDCRNGKDEGASCPIHLLCNGRIDCYSGDDERNCSTCPLYSPNRCACNNPDNFSCEGRGSTCFSDAERCDGYASCIDGSDEQSCSCGPDQFSCRCKDANPACRGQLCIPMEWYHDEEEDCPDGSDEEGFVPNQNFYRLHATDVFMP